MERIKVETGKCCPFVQNKNIKRQSLYIFVNKRRNRIKLLHYETGGMVIYAKMLDRGTFGMPIPASEDALTRRIRWEDLLKMVEGIMSDPESRQARLDGLKNLWKN